MPFLDWLQKLWPFGDDQDEKPTLHGLELKFHQWEPILPPDLWTWAGITSVNTTHEAALFQQSARLADTLFRDDRIAGLLTTRIDEIRGLPFWFNDPDGLVSEDEQLYKDWLTMFPKTKQLEATFWTLVMGFCLAQLRWNMDTMVPTVQIWHPGNCYWDKTWQHWIIYTREGGPVRLIGENAPGNGKWILFKTWIDERPWYAGIIRAIGLLLLIRSVCLPDWLRYARKFGSASTILKVPNMAGEIDDVQKTINQLAQLNNGSVIHLFNDMDAKLLEPNGNSWEVFAKLLEYVDRALELLILGSADVASSSRYGSRAGAIVKDKPRQGRLENDIDILSTTAREQILHPYYIWNRGIDNLEEVPTPLWDPTPPEAAVQEADELTKRAAGAKSAAEALEKIIEIYPDIDVDAWAQQYKWPAKDKNSAGRGRSAARASLAGSHERVLRNAKPEAAVPGLAALIEAVKSAKDVPDLRQRVLETYKKLDPERLARELAAARVRAEKSALQAVEDRLHAR
jgi:hypothetical protein